ncbi:MAG: hypothetical protein KDA41_09050, partial [Planctomycetales bacterium]|nr:hypothetical protein [Planctomycetales bacterium]
MRLVLWTFVGSAVLAAGVVAAQDKGVVRSADEGPPVPQFQRFPVDSKYIVGRVRVFYAAAHPHVYFALSNMPQGVAYFHVDLKDDAAATKFKLLQLAAE